MHFYLGINSYEAFTRDGVEKERRWLETGLVNSEDALRYGFSVSKQGVVLFFGSVSVNWGWDWNDA